MFTHHQAMAYRRLCVTGLRFDGAYPIGADYAFTLDTLSRFPRVARISVPLTVFASGGRSQQDPASGRRDQDRIRLSRMGMPAFSRLSIRAVQWLAIFVRRRWPIVFETFRCRRMYE